MRKVLIKKLAAYIRDNNPDIFAELNEVNLISNFIETKVDSVENMWEESAKNNTPAYITEEMCMSALTKDLKPSKYNYILNLLEEDFEFAHQQMSLSGTLQMEVINMIQACEPVFESFKFSEETEDNRHIRYAVIQTVNDYLNNN